MTRLRTIALALALVSPLAFARPPLVAAQQLVFESFPASALIRGENVWVRLDPAPDTEVITLLQRGDPITITGESVVEGDDEYYPIASDLTGDTGWIRALFIDPRSIAGASTVVVPLEEVDVPPDEVEVVDDPATQRQQDREARRQTRQDNAQQEPAHEPEQEPAPEEPADDRAARRAARETAAESEQPADDRAARRAERQAGQDGNGNAANASADTLTFSGTEPTVTPEFTAPADVLTVTGSYEGDENFIVLAVTPDGVEELLFNEIGPFSGETAFEIEAGSTLIIDVEANGPWEVVIEPAF